MYLKENEINQMKLKLNNNKTNLFSLDDVIIINFVSTEHSINKGIKCLETDTFAEVEEKFYQIYDEFRNTNNALIINGRTILRFKSLKENNVRDGDSIMLIKIE